MDLQEVPETKIFLFDRAVEEFVNEGTIYAAPGSLPSYYFFDIPTVKLESAIYQQQKVPDQPKSQRSPKRTFDFAVLAKPEKVPKEGMAVLPQ
jgi:hypothetical protein